MKYKILTKAFLYQKYSVEKHAAPEIAKIVGCSKATVWRYLVKCNIRRRTYSEVFKNRKVTEEWRRNLSSAMKDKYKGKNHPMYGKHHTKKTKEKMSKTRKGKNNPMYGVHRFGEKNPRWRGGKVKNGQGYILIKSPNHPYANNLNYVREHRLVIEKQIGRYLKPTEKVHHINHIKDDNRPENLMVFTSNSAHRRFHKDPKLVKKNEIIFDGRNLK